jgi:4-oxalocrotonate tautomerase
MPIVSLKLVEGVFGQEELERLAQELTEAVVRVGGEGIRPGVHVTIELVKCGLWCTGGTHLRTEEILTRRGKRPASP